MASSSRLLAEVTRVIIDVGQDSCKVGIEGEGAPRLFVKTQPYIDAAVEQIQLFSSSSSSSSSSSILPMKRRMTAATESEERLWRRVFVLLFADVFNRHASVPAKETPVVVVESLLLSAAVRRAIAFALFDWHAVPSALFLLGQSLPLLALERRTGLVVDIGLTETIVLPVAERRPITSAMRRCPLGVDAVLRRLRRLSPAAGVSTDAAKEVLATKITFASDAKDRVSRACAAVLFGRNDNDDNDDDGDGDYHDDGVDVDRGVTIQKLIIDAVSACGIDIRAALFQNILLIGGGAMLAGIHLRLRNAVRAVLLAQPKTEKLAGAVGIVSSVIAADAESELARVSIAPNILAWSGASVLVKVVSSRREAQLGQWITLEKYKSQVAASKGSSRGVDLLLPDYFACLDAPL